MRLGVATAQLTAHESVNLLSVTSMLSTPVVFLNCKCVAPPRNWQFATLWRDVVAAGVCASKATIVDMAGEAPSTWLIGAVNSTRSKQKSDL